MPRTIDQIRASKLPSNMMQFAARGALQVPAAENIEILVYLARHNKVFGDLARMTLAGWDEKSSLAAARRSPNRRAKCWTTSSRPTICGQLAAGAARKSLRSPKARWSRSRSAASRDSIAVMLKSPRVRSLSGVLAGSQGESIPGQGRSRRSADAVVQCSPDLHNRLLPRSDAAPAVEHARGFRGNDCSHARPVPQPATNGPTTRPSPPTSRNTPHDIAAEGDKPFQAIGGIVDLLGEDYFPVHEVAETPHRSRLRHRVPPPRQNGRRLHPRSPTSPAKRENALQKISHLDVKGRIQLALKGNKEERSLLIRDGTKVVALAVLEAPKLSDGEVEKFASQKNVLESVLRQIPLKRRFMKNYKVVRNLVANPRTPLDLGLGLMKNLLIASI